MPDWQPNWDDVEFDHTLAQAAADECRRAAGSLTNVVDGLDGAQTALVADAAWTGTYRDDYDVEQPLVRSDAIATRDALTTLAGDIETAMAAAETEQAQRVADRQRWREERDQELADQGWHRLPSGKLNPI